MATDGASCEPDFSRAPEDAAGATAEAAVTEVQGWGGDRGDAGRGHGWRPGALHQSGRPPPRVPPPQGAFIARGQSLWGGVAPRAGDRSCPFRAPWAAARREAAGSAGCSGLPACARCDPRPTPPSLQSALARGETWGVFPGELEPPLFASRARGCGRVSPGCLVPLSGPRRAARGRRVIAEQVWGCPLCVCPCA